MTKDIVFSPKNLSALLIDRKPCAHAELFSTGGKSPARGSIRLYATPLGVLVRADFDGLSADEKAHRLRVRFDGKHHTTTLPCSQGGGCQCLTAAFAVEDVVGRRVSLLSEERDTPLALGELRLVSF